MKMNDQPRVEVIPHFGSQASQASQASQTKKRINEITGLQNQVCNTMNDGHDLQKKTNDVDPLTDTIAAVELQLTSWLETVQSDRVGTTFMIDS